LDAKDKKSRGYDRLYFDLNANGDLTDDQPIDALTTESPRVVFPSEYSDHQFPRVDLSIPWDGKSLEYSFQFSADTYGSSSYRYASASLRAAVYRVGQITLEGQKH